MFQFNPVDHTGEIIDKTFIAFEGRQLQPVYKNITQFTVPFLMNHPTPIGNIDIPGIQLIQLPDRYRIQNTLFQRFHTFDRMLIIIQGTHTERKIAFPAEPGSGLRSVMQKERAGHSFFYKIDMLFDRISFDNQCILRIYLHVHARSQCLKRFLRHRIIFPYFTYYILQLVVFFLASKDNLFSKGSGNHKEKYLRKRYLNTNSNFFNILSCFSSMFCIFDAMLFCFRRRREYSRRCQKYLRRRQKYSRRRRKQNNIRFIYKYEKEK